MKGATTMEIKKSIRNFLVSFAVLLIICCPTIALPDLQQSLIVLGHWERLRQDLAFYAVLPQSQPVAQGFRTWSLH